MSTHGTDAGVPAPDPALAETCERCGAALAPDAFACTGCGLRVVPRMTAAWKRVPRSKPHGAAARSRGHAPMDARRTDARVPAARRGAARTTLQFGSGTLRSGVVRMRLAAAAHLLGVGGLLGLALSAYLPGRLAG